MSEFKFSCPGCGQHLAAEEGWSGVQIRCPHCQSPFVVPRVVAAARPVASPALAVSVPPPAPPVAAVARPAAPVSAMAPASAQAFCGLAIVSFVLSLATLPLNAIGFFLGFPLGLLGCIPGVVCGHLALGRIGKNRVLRGGALAKWGLGLGYAFILLGVVSLGLFALVKMAGPNLVAARNARGPAAPPPFATGPSRPGAPPFPGKPDGAPAAPSAPPVGLADPPVTTNPERVEIPTKPAAGTLYDQPFTVDKAKVTAGMLDLAQGKGAIPDADIKIFLFLKPGESLAERTFTVSPGSTHGNPHVHLAQRAGGGSRGILTSRYALRLEFEKPTGRKIPFKLYFEAPSSYGTLVSGNCVADLQ